MINLFGNILEFVSFTFIACKMLECKFPQIKYTLIILFYILPDILIDISNINVFPDIDFFLSLITLVVYLCIALNIDFITSLSANACSYFTIIALQFLLVVINTFILHLDTNTTLAIVGPIYTLLVSILIYRYINLSKIFGILFQSGKTGKFIMANLYTVAAIIAIYFHANLTTYYENILFIIVALALIIICNLLLSNQLGKIKQQELRLNTYAEYLPVLEDLIHTVRIRQHNYNNQLQSIAGLLYTNKDYASLSKALEEQFKLATNSDVPEYLLKVNLPVVAGFLYQKSNEAKKNNKTLELEFNTYTLTSRVPEYDLIEMFAILIDNALDAIPTGDTVHVAVTCDGKHITFITRNAGDILTPEDRKRFFSKGYSTKKDNNHSGLGLYQLNRLIKQYSGSTISLWNEGTDILFQITV